MHIPDHIVSMPVNAVTMVAATAALAVSLWHVKRATKTAMTSTPVLAMVAAFIFAIQMINFPIGGGTSGHFLGAVAAAAVLGPWGACLALSLVLMVQGIFFADGGMTAIGSNIVNMGVIGGLLAYPLMRRLRALLPAGKAGFLAAAAGASWLSLMMASAACAVELALSGTSPLATALPAMVSTHALIGLGEATLTVAALAALVHFKPTLLPSWALMGHTTSQTDAKNVVAGGLVVALLLATIGSPFASTAPDGLEKIVTASHAVWSYSAFADYQIAAIASEGLSTGLAGFIGTMIVFAVGFALTRFTSRASAT
ncbi:MAG TPA: cobalt transporter [Rhodospirillaceae bacterium]|nr:cobalt transporter [Rhodospirillaceae bacterium]